MLRHKQPKWIIPNAFADLDFSNRRWWGGYVDTTSGQDKASFMTDNGAYGVLTTGLLPYTPTKSGFLYKGLENQNRITDLGYFTERGGVNNCFWCRDLTQAASAQPWVATSATVVKNQVGNVQGESGSNASSMTATASGGTSTVLQSITLSSRVVIFSCYIKRLSGTGTIKITNDGSTYTDVTAQVAAVTNISGYAWVQCPQQTLSSVVCGIQLGTSGDSIAVDFCQLETSYTGQYANLGATDMATTPLMTTTAASSRANNTGYWQKNNQVSANPNGGQRIINDVFSYGGPWSMIASFNGDLINATEKGPSFIATDFSGNPIALSCGAGVGGFGNNFANQTSNFCNIGRGNWNIGAFTCSGAGTKSCLNGGAPSAFNSGAGTKPSPNNGFPSTDTHFNMFNNGSGTVGAPLNGSVGRIAFLKQEMSDSALTEWTSLTGRFATF